MNKSIPHLMILAVCMACIALMLTVAPRALAQIALDTPQTETRPTKVTVVETTEQTVVAVDWDRLVIEKDRKTGAITVRAWTRRLDKDGRTVRSLTQTLTDEQVKLILGEAGFAAIKATFDAAVKTATEAK